MSRGDPQSTSERTLGTPRRRGGADERARVGCGICMSQQALAGGANEPLEGSTVFVVDDDASLRDSLKRLLSSEGLRVIAFETARAFLDGLELHGGPSCAVLDVFLPDLNGLQLQQRLLELDAPPAVIFLSGCADIPMSVRAMKGGALEFLTKPFEPAELVEAVKAALLSEAKAQEERATLNELRQRYRTLTARERDVMAGVLDGLLNKQIAASFGTSEMTVKEQRAQVMRKMAANSAAELVRMGITLELVRSK